MVKPNSLTTSRCWQLRDSFKILGNKDMDNWIPFAEGEYLVDEALLVADNRNAVPVENAIIEVYSGPPGSALFKGSGTHPQYPDDRTA